MQQLGTAAVHLLTMATSSRAIASARACSRAAASLIRVFGQAQPCFLIERVCGLAGLIETLPRLFPKPDRVALWHAPKRRLALFSC